MKIARSYHTIITSSHRMKILSSYCMNTLEFGTLCHKAELNLNQYSWFFTTELTYRTFKKIQSMQKKLNQSVTSMYSTK